MEATLARTTLDLPAPLMREIKSRAALSGLSMKAFVTQIMEKAVQGVPAETVVKSTTEDEPDWMAFAGVLKDSPNFNGDPVAIQRKMRREWDR